MDDDSSGTAVVYRNLWDEISQDLPKRAARAARTRAEEPSLPPKLETALFSLYANYEKTFRGGRWGFVEVGDPSTCRAAIARAVDELASSARVV